MAALDECAGYADRVLMHLRVRDLVRHEHRVLVRDEKVDALRQVALRHAHDVHAEYLAAYALGDRLTREHIHAGELVRGAHELVHLAGQVQIAVVVRDERIIERLRGVRDLADDVGAGRLFALRNRACHGHEALEGVLVGGRGGLLAQLEAQHVSGVLDEVLVEVVALVDGEGKRLVLRHGQLLHDVLHLGDGAVAAEAAVAVIIDLLDGDRGVDLERLDAGQVERLGGLALDEGRAGENLCDLVGILACKIDCHR